MGIRIKGTGRYTPDKILTNDDLEKIVETSDEWIVSRTGIKERHIATAEQSSSDMAAIAAQNALENAGLTADQIDLIIVSTVTPDHAFPSVSALVQHKIGAGKCPCFDIEAACSGLRKFLITSISILLQSISIVHQSAAEHVTELVTYILRKKEFLVRSSVKNSVKAKIGNLIQNSLKL